VGRPTARAALKANGAGANGNENSFNFVGDGC
jgi:hypothetical protein